MMQKMRTFYLTGSEIFDGFSGPFYYENYNMFVKNKDVIKTRPSLHFYEKQFSFSNKLSTKIDE